MGLRSLRALSIAFLAVFLVVTIGAGTAIYAATHRAIVRLVDQRIADESGDVAGRGAPGSRATVLARIDQFIGDRDTGDIGIELTDRAGRHLAGNYRSPRRLPIGYSSLGRRDRIKGLTHGRALVRDIGGGMMLTTFAETEPVDDYNAERLRIYLIGFGAIVVLVIVALAVFMRAIGHRIAAQNATAEAIIDGDMRRRVPVGEAHSEFDEQARIFNRMLDRIGELMAGLTHISSDIAHDLRTPLARLRHQLVAIQRLDASEAVGDEIDAAILQCDQILAMFAAVLRIVEIEGGDRRAAFVALDLATLATRTAGIWTPIAEEAGHALSVEAVGTVPIVGDRQLLDQAIINLVENALRHTPAGSRIMVSVVRDGGHAVLTVGDDGPGIADEDHGRALRRFGRVDRSRARAGHGLGLPLVDAIVRLHRGTLTLGDAAPGLRVTIVLPIA